MVAALLFLSFAGVALAQQLIYQNFSVLDYTIPGSPPPTIDAINFDNENQFIVNFEGFDLNAQFYEPENTVNYTNDSSSIMSVNGNGGFQFDTLTTNVQPHQMAGTFFNSGLILCDSILNGNNVVNIGGTEFFLVAGIGQCLVSATNIICPGTIETSAGGFMSFNGQNVDLDHSVLTIESSQQAQGDINNAAFIGAGFSAINTNDWDPSVELATNFADSFQLALLGSVAYFQTNTVNTNVITRSAFVEDTSPPSVTNNVWFGPAALATGSGEVAVGWMGTYLNFATGKMATNYLYLNDDYVAGDSTNVPITVFGWPTNFTLTASTTPLITNAPAVPGLAPFPAGPQTNNIYVFAIFESDAVEGTNASAINPSGAITNLSGRIQITASHELSLHNASISGVSYLSLTSTNEFDGNLDAGISALYSDINLGNTNGSLTISNLLQSQIPDWNGTIVAWSTRFLETTTNGQGTNAAQATNDFRVLLVQSQLNPVTTPSIRNLTLSATNSLFISDVLNVFGSLSANAQSLTLTTNGLGTGAGSPDGELNLLNADPIAWSWNGSFPNLLWLTNNGAIRLPNFSQFIGNTQIVTAVAGTPAVQAATLLSEGRGTNVIKNSTVTIGAITYTFTNSITRKTPPDYVKIGKTFDGSLSNLIAAINAGSGRGTNYSTNTFANSTATAGLLVAHAFTVSASTNYPGTLGNGIPVATTATNLVWSSLELAGGVDAIPGTTNIASAQAPYGAFINNGLLYDQGSTISADNFQSTGVISNGLGSFILTSATATFAGGVLQAGEDVSITATTVTTSNLLLQAGRSLTFDAPLLLTDMGQSNANIWTVGSTNGTGGNGLMLPVKPASGDLLGTTIAMTAPPPNKQISSTWAASDDGASTSGFNNNVALGQLSLDVLGASSSFYFTGVGTPGVNNAIYVDRLILNHYASNANAVGSTIPTILINTNFTIYYADAVASTSVSGGSFTNVSSQLNGFNGGHLVWVQGFHGFFDATNVPVPSAFVSHIVVPPPAISAVTTGKGGKFLLNISGSGAAVVIQSSTNLVNWTSLYTNAPPFVFTDAVPATSQCRFYRAIVP